MSEALDKRDEKKIAEKAENAQAFSGSTTAMANLLGINKASARDELAAVQAEGKTVSNVQIEKAENSEMTSTGLEAIAELAHNITDPLAGLTTTVAMSDVKDNVKEEKPLPLPEPRPEGNVAERDEKNESASMAGESEPAVNSAPTPFKMRFTR